MADVSKVKLNGTAYNIKDASVPSWAKQSSKPSYTQDEVGDGSTYKRVTSTEKSTWNNKGTYSKPSGGIPKSDLASAVQTSLGKADTALQSFTETDPTVPSWAKSSSKPTYTASEVGAIAASAKGAASGVAELDANGKVPSSQLPSYVDDVLEYSAKSSFPSTGETGKIYVDTSNNKTYRWSGSAYVEISPSLALGTTSSTAYRGDRGNTAYSHATDSGRLTTATASGLYKVASTAQGHIASLTQVEKADITALGIPGQDTTYSAATTSAAGLMSADDKTKLNGIASGATAVSESTVSGWGFTKNTGTYSKPSTGIPKSDLASAVQTSLGKADSALQSHQTIKQDGVTGATVNRFGTCGTAAATAAKTVSITTGTFTLEAGARVTVKFSNANTAGTPTLNVNSTGAKNIYSKGSQITTGSNKSLLAGTVDFIYDGTQYHLIGNYIDTNTTYSSKSEASGGTDVSLCTTGEKYTWNSKGTYSKPSGGIPKSDLASAVQTSLGKADTALQSFTETDPTVPSWAKQSSKPSYTYSEVGAAPSSHTHGNIQNGGTLQTNDITIASGDKLVVTDSSDSSKIARASISFDGSTTTQALTKAGSWQTFNNYTHPSEGGNTGSFGPSASVSPGFGGTFSVPYVTVNAKGHVTAASTKTITMPNFTATPYTQPTKHSNITSIDSGGYIQIGKLVIVNMRFTVGTACGQYTDLFTDLPLPLTPLSGGSACVACSSNNNTLMICANGRMQNYDSGSLAAGVYVVSTVYIGQ